MEKLKKNMLNDMSYKVAVLAAGRGSRLNDLTKDVNKALLPINYQAVITRILEKFPVEVEIVMAVGYQKEKLQEYLSVVHPERNIQYVEVDKISGEGSGPGYSLLQCRDKLQLPFIITTVDTLVVEDVPSPAMNWLGISLVEDTSQYNSVNFQGGFVDNMRDKEKCDNTHAFIGLAGIKDYEIFWKALAEDRGLIANERQLSNGLQKLLEGGMGGVEFSWLDTGDRESLEEANKYFAKSKKGFDFSKTDEYLYFVGDKVVKYFNDKKIVDKRVARARQMEKVVPKMGKVTSHFFSYKKVLGKTVYESLTPRVVKELLNWLQKNVWQKIDLNEADRAEFKQACWRFYYDKTMSRLEKYYETTREVDEMMIVNDQALPKLSELMKHIDWHKLSEGIPSPFHGDLQFDNVLVKKGKTNDFVLLDWRQDFAGLTKYGDLYYDLAKLNGGTIVPYNLIKKNMFSFEKFGNYVNFDIASSYNLKESQQIFHQFVQDNGYDMKKIKMLTALIFLNMSPLHHEPFNRLLYSLAKLELTRALDYEQATNH